MKSKDVKVCLVGWLVGWSAMAAKIKQMTLKEIRANTETLNLCRNHCELT